MYCVSVYRAPTTRIEEDTKLLSLMQTVLVLGDFRFPDINLENESASRETLVLQWLLLHGLTQHTRQDARHRVGQSPSLLDLVITGYQGNKAASFEIVLFEETVVAD